MRALLRKGFYMTWPIYATALGIALAAGLLPDRQDLEYIRNAGQILPVILVLIGGANVRAVDDKCGWDRYVRMLPYSPRDVVFSHILLQCFAVGTAALAVILQGVCVALRTGAWEKMAVCWAVLALMVPFFLGVMSPYEMLLNALGYERGRRWGFALYAAVVALIPGGIVFLAAMDYDRLVSAVWTLLENSGNVFALGMVPAVLMNAVCIPLAIRAYGDRREEGRPLKISGPDREENGRFS